MTETENAQRRLIRTIAKEVAYEVLFEHLEEYVRISKPKKLYEKNEKSKVCPFAAAHPQQENSDCLGESCGCYIKINKPRQVQTYHSQFADPEYFYRYVGCGLVAHVPWELMKREEKQENRPPKIIKLK